MVQLSELKFYYIDPIISRDLIFIITLKTVYHVKLIGFFR